VREVKKLMDMNYNIMYKLKPKLIERSEVEGQKLNKSNLAERKENEISVGRVIDEVNIDKYVGMSDK
jgi:hypothetical protein